jgi:hypothetical protein
MLEQSASENTSLMRDDRLATVYKVRTLVSVDSVHEILTGNKQEIKNFNNLFEIKEIGKPKSWRLLTQSTAERDVEEAIFTIQGVLESKELPPLREKPR